MDGAYSQGYEYDPYGNVTRRYGWGGEAQGGGPSASTDFTYAYTNNRRSGFSYDASGNLTFDGGQHFTYDAAGRQVSSDYTDLHNSYDGDGLRVKKAENNSSYILYYLRSTVLGGQVLADLSNAGGWHRGYVYAGGDLLAVQQGGVYFVHEDPVTKSKRVTDASGAVVSAVELDPFGADTLHSGNSSFQPRKFTSYERDSNGSDEAMYRRYNRWHSRFDQPDPYDGSYDLTNPQSLNRYSYVSNDPVNKIDPSGLDGVVIDTGPAVVVVANLPGVTMSGAGWMSTLAGLGGGGSPLDELSPGESIGGGEGPQNPTPLTPGEVNSLRREVDKSLTKTCTDFLNAVFAALQKQNPQNPAVSTNIGDLFDRVRNQPRGGFFSQPGAVSTVNGLLKNGNGQVINGRATSPFYIGVKTIHELVHIAGQNAWYSDRAAALAVQQVLRDHGRNWAADQLDKRDPNNVSQQSDWWDSHLAAACRNRAGER